jgi:hypothetical protein
MDGGRAYFAIDVSYADKMFIKLTTGEREVEVVVAGIGRHRRRHRDAPV